MTRSNIIRPLRPANFIILIVVSLVFFVSGAEPLSAADPFAGSRFTGQGDEPWKITAKRLSYRSKEGIYDAEGDVVISRENMTLYAQKVLYHTETGLAEAEGDVQLVSGQDTLAGDKGVFNFKDQTGHIINGKLFMQEGHFYIKGDLLEKRGMSTYRVENCMVTTCDGDNPVWSITGSEVDVTIEGYGTVKNADMRLRGLPVLYFPYMIFPAKTERQTGLLLPSFGHSGRNGEDFKIPLFLALSQQTDATLYFRYMTQRGYMQGLEYRYIMDETSEGQFLFDILYDQREKDLEDARDLILSPFPRTNQTRYWLRGKADQNLPGGISARLDADFVSDQDYIREFSMGDTDDQNKSDLEKELGRPLEEKYSPYRTSSIRLSRDDEDYSLQAQSSYYQLPGDPDRHKTAEPLGSLDFSLLPVMINSSPVPAFFSLESGYDYVWRDEGRQGHRYSITPGIRFPFHPTKYIEFEPAFQYTFNPQWFDDLQGGIHQQSLTSYEATTTVSTTLDRIFDIDFLGAKRMKHRVRPVLEYKYREYSGVTYDDDEEDYANPWFEPLAREDDANQISVGIENFLDARFEDNQGNVLYRQWIKFRLTQPYSLAEKKGDYQTDDDDRKPFEPLDAELSLTPYRYLNIFARGKWDHYERKISFADLSAAFLVDRSGDRHDRYQVSYLYGKENEEDEKHDILVLWCDVNIASGFSAGGSLARVFNYGESIFTRFWLEYKAQCWGIKTIVEDESESTTVMFQIELFGLGHLGFD